MKTDAIVLAGGKLKDSNEDKALVRLGELTLADRTIQTLQSCSIVSKIIVTSLPKSFKPETGADQLIRDTGDLMDNITLALNKAQSKKVLLVASDIPLLTPLHVSNFVDLCTKLNAGVYYPLIPKSAMGSLGFMKRTYFKLDKVEFTGGNLILVEKDVFLRNIDMARKIFELRKSPLRLSLLLGFPFLFKLAFGRLSVSEAEQKASKILGSTVKGIIISHPEIGSDVDKIEDLKYMEQVFERNK